MSADRAFEVVFVCTGNVFRSAIAEGLLREKTRGLPVHVSSAGTLDLGSARALPQALELAPRLGIDLAAHRSRCVAGIDLSDVDLVIGFERAHVAAAVVDSRADRGRTFTLPELVGLLERVRPAPEGDVAERGREAVRRAHALRAGSSALPTIADPIGGTRAVFASTATRIADLTSKLSELLFRP